MLRNVNCKIFGCFTEICAHTLTVNQAYFLEWPESKASIPASILTSEPASKPASIPASTPASKPASIPASTPASIPTSILHF